MPHLVPQNNAGITCNYTGPEYISQGLRECHHVSFGVDNVQVGCMRFLRLLEVARYRYWHSGIGVNEAPALCCVSLRQQLLHRDLNEIRVPDVAVSVC